MSLQKLIYQKYKKLQKPLKKTLKKIQKPKVKKIKEIYKYRKNMKNMKNNFKINFPYTLIYKLKSLLKSKKINLYSIFFVVFLLTNLINLTVFSKDYININLNLLENSSIYSNSNSNSISNYSNSIQTLQFSEQISSQTQNFGNSVLILSSNSTNSQLITILNSQNSSQNNSNLTLILTNSPNSLPTNSPNSINFQPNIITNSTNFVTNTIRTGGFGGFILIFALLILAFCPIFLIHRFKNSKIQIINQKKTNFKKSKDYYKD